MAHTETWRLGDFTCRVTHTDRAGALAPLADSPRLLVSDTAIVQALQLTSPDLLALPPGESAKNWAQIETIVHEGFKRGLARDAVFFGVGGGVVCDITAFAASVYLRGCRLVLVPTTLLAMVDASFGGKTGINFGGYKNMVGTFYPAEELRICPEFLQTLPAHEFASGLGEVIKHALLGEQDLWRLLHDQRKKVQSRDPAVLQELVERSLAVKGRVVEADFKEQSVRAHLNLGHTFAHGLESVAGFGAWTHGEAVAWGMVKATQLACRLGLAAPTWLDEVRSLVESYGYRTHSDADPTALLAAMKLDKKKKGGTVRFVLQRGFGETLTQAVDDTDILAVLDLP